MKFLIWLFFVPLIVFGQSNSIKGTISEGVDSTVSYNTFITIEQLNLTTKTDSSGTFLFTDIPDGNYNLIIFKKGYITLLPNPTLIAFNGSYNLRFHLDKLPFDLSETILSSYSQNEILLDTKVVGSFYNKDELLLSNSLDNIINKNTNAALVYQKYFDGTFIYNGVALENNIYLDNIKLSGINPIIYASLINTNFLNRIEIVANNASLFNVYPETEKINLFSNKGKNRFNVVLFTSNQKVSLSSYYNGRVNISSALLDSINYFLSFSKTNNIDGNKSDPNINYPIGDFFNFYGTSQFVINKSQSFNLSYLFVQSEQAPSLTHDVFNTIFDIYSTNYNLLNINLNSITRFSKNENLSISFTYNKSKKHESFSENDLNNSTNNFTTLIKFKTSFSKNINFNIGYQNNYYVTDYSNSQYFERDHSLNVAFDMLFKKLSISPFFSLIYYDKNKFLSLPGVNVSYKTLENSSLVFNYSVGYNKTNTEKTIEANYKDNMYWETIGKYRPELYKNLSITFRYTDFDFYSIELSAYQINYENVLKRTLLATNEFHSYKLINYEKIITNGSSLYLKLTPVRNITISVNYSFQDVKDGHSNKLKLRAEHSGFSTLQYKNYTMGLKATFELRYYGDKYVPYYYTEYKNFSYYNEKTFKSNEALISNVYIEKRLIKNLLFTIGAYNIFDHKTEDYCNYKPLEYFVKINYSL